MKSIIITVFLLILVSCKEKPAQYNPEEDPRYLEVMEIHDEVMPEMATIHSLKRNLKSLEDIEESVKLLVRNEIKKLDDADEAMMSWMAEFKLPDNVEQRTLFLDTEKQKIQAVSDEMRAAITSAKFLLDSLSSITVK